MSPICHVRITQKQLYVKTDKVIKLLFYHSNCITEEALDEDRQDRKERMNGKKKKIGVNAFRREWSDDQV